MAQNVILRMKRIHLRIAQLQQKQARCVNYILSAACLLLTGSLSVLLHQEHLSGLSIVLAGYGSVLLHSGTDGYIVVGVGFFVAGVLFTLLCLRLRQRKSQSHRSSPDASAELSPAEQDSRS